MKQEIIDGDKLIALFDGYQETGKLHPFDATKGITLRHPDKAGETWVAELKYHSSWDWLMPVVEKISRIPYPDSSWDKCEPFENCAWPRTFGMLNTDGKPMVRLQASALFTADTLIEACWLAVVDFTQWYNQNKPQ